MVSGSRTRKEIAQSSGEILRKYASANTASTSADPTSSSAASKRRSLAVADIPSDRDRRPRSTANDQRRRSVAAVQSCALNTHINLNPNPILHTVEELSAERRSSSSSQHKLDKSSALAEAMALASGGAMRKTPKYRRIITTTTSAANNNSSSEKPRQEISRCLKYTVFSFNFLIAVLGITAMIIGAYLYASYYTPITEILDFVFNPGLLLLWLGAVVTIISLLGAFGALRDDLCQLKAFSLLVFLCYICLVVVAFLLFILFYSQASDGISIQSLMMHTVRRYHENYNVKEVVDAVQMDLQCCGVSSRGFKDWTYNAQYNCSAANRAIERCGVPFSCCRRPIVTGESAGTNVEHANSLVHSMPSHTCWQHAQNRSLTEVSSQINVEGCINPVQRAFERHAVTIGAIVGAFVIPVCISVTLANILAKQVERQKYLLGREERRNERRKRRDRHRFRDPFAENHKPGSRASPSGDVVTVDETKPNRRKTSPSAPSNPAKKQRAVRARRSKSSAAIIAEPTSSGSNSAERSKDRPRSSKPRRPPTQGDDKIRTRPGRERRSKSSAAVQQSSRSPDRKTRTKRSSDAQPVDFSPNPIIT